MLRVHYTAAAIHAMLRVHYTATATHVILRVHYTATATHVILRVHYTAAAIHPILRVHYTAAGTHVILRVHYTATAQEPFYMLPSKNTVTVRGVAVRSYKYNAFRNRAYKCVTNLGNYQPVVTPVPVVTRPVVTSVL